MADLEPACYEEGAITKYGVSGHNVPVIHALLIFTFTTNTGTARTRSAAMNQNA